MGKSHTNRRYQGGVIPTMPRANINGISINYEILGERGTPIAEVVPAKSTI